MTSTSGPVLLLLEGAARESSRPFKMTAWNPLELPIHPLDLGVTRGDGVFESVGVIDGRPMELHAHLERLERSAEMLDLQALHIGAIGDGVVAAIRQHDPVPELLVKIFVTRGREHEFDPTVWIYGMEGPDYSSDRSNGIDVVTLNRGYPRNIAQVAPWLLQGAKTLSYAVNRAALREAARRGADDAVFLSSDGYVLEGPASTLIIRDSTGYRTPPADDGVLPGTTQARIFAGLEAAGYRTLTGPIEEKELRSAEAAWLVSSGRMCVPIRALDGCGMEIDHQATQQMMAILVRPSHSDGQDRPTGPSSPRASLHGW
ncbi:aminotransferase class IV [Paenarthrobacter sp. NPDC091711]|uniref:aminotransferase class IV n=1 Tax=Paenarthrobacter sp. NPDC091711 TaxID=3364385 RepID=UPI00381048C6